MSKNTIQSAIVIYIIQILIVFIINTTELDVPNLEKIVFDNDYFDTTD